MNYKCREINPNRGGSYTDSPVWIKNEKATINPINKKDSKCFQHTITVGLNHFKIKMKIKPFINRYNWEGINFPSKQMIGKNFNKNNVTNTLIVFYAKKKKYILMFQNITQS